MVKCKHTTFCHFLEYHKINRSIGTSEYGFGKLLHQTIKTPRESYKKTIIALMD